MNLSEWRHVQATDPATADQVGAVAGQFERLGYGRADRAERLAICAALLGLDELESTKALTLGEAGQLYRLLLDISDRDELLAAAAITDEGQDAAPEPAMTFADAIGALITQLHAIFTTTEKATP